MLFKSDPGSWVTSVEGEAWVEVEVLGEGAPVLGGHLPPAADGEVFKASHDLRSGETAHTGELSPPSRHSGRHPTLAPAEPTCLKSSSTWSLSAEPLNTSTRNWTRYEPLMVCRYPTQPGGETDA